MHIRSIAYTRCYIAATVKPLQQLQAQGPPKDLKHPSAAAAAVAT
jgi:hypothetical protein